MFYKISLSFTQIKLAQVIIGFVTIEIYLISLLMDTCTVGRHKKNCSSINPWSKIRGSIQLFFDNSLTEVSVLQEKMNGKYEEDSKKTIVIVRKIFVFPAFPEAQGRTAKVRSIFFLSFYSWKDFLRVGICWLRQEWKSRWVNVPWRFIEFVNFTLQLFLLRAKLTRKMSQNDFLPNNITELCLFLFKSNSTY